MLHWSKYNTLFHSERFGYFLYNALSNTFFEIDKTHFLFLEELRNNPQMSSPAIDHQFQVLLQEQKILVKEGEEKKDLMTRHYRRNLLSLDNSHLNLSICPTFRCNFRCPYCFEHTQQSATVMHAETVNQLISFIKNFRNISRLSVTWYGGEPTLAFGVIQNITRRIKELDIAFEEAGLVTNAYLLNSEKISQLNDLNIKAIQITLDGPENLHDTRRVLANGHPTYQRIMSNIDVLMNSTYEGSCNIRVNIDKNNISGFFGLRSYLLERFKGKNLSVYAGIVDTARGRNFDNNCNLCAKEWKEFTIAQYRHISDTPSEGIYPVSNVCNICSANSLNSFVIGPEGELYKCWEDVGKQDMVVGSIFMAAPLSNSELVTLYNVGSDPYLDTECWDCKVLPICGGGCANRRLRAKHFHEEDLEFCSLYKDNLVTYLLEYYDVLLTKELCGDVLNQHAKVTNKKGYRMVHPERKETESRPD
jgi:uncharacterized protein